MDTCEENRLGNSFIAVGAKPARTIPRKGIFDLATRSEVARLARPTMTNGLAFSPDGARFSPDGTLLASVSTDRSLRLWDVATQQPLGACSPAAIRSGCTPSPAASRSCAAAAPRAK